MSVLAKLNLKTVQQRSADKDPTRARRNKLVAAIEQQKHVLTAALAGEEYTVPVQRWATDADGQRVKVDAAKRVRAWFFELDSGYYVQCRYGARVLLIKGKSNAVFVDELADVAAVLDAFSAAALAGDFDKAVSLAASKARDPAPSQSA